MTARGYSIRVATGPGGPCAHCREPTGAGPVGYQDEHPICDLCLLEHCQPLGMVLALAAITRAFAAHGPAASPAALAELADFARTYEQIAAKHGPRRPLAPEKEPS